MTDTASDPASAPSRLATASVWIGALGCAAAVLGVLGIQAGVLSPFVGFRLFLAGAVLGGLLAILVGLVGIAVTRGGRDPAGRRSALVGAGIGGALLLSVLLSAGQGLGLPAINDISTDLADPPVFTASARLPDNAGRDMSYPAEFVPIVRQAYPDLAPLQLPVDPDQAFERALEAAEALGWDVSFRDPQARTFEAQQTTAIFRFVDDVVVRVRPAATGGSRVDVRSKSRVGKGDVGANAARIRAFAVVLAEPTP